MYIGYYHIFLNLTENSPKLSQILYLFEKHYSTLRSFFQWCRSRNNHPIATWWNSGQRCIWLIFYLFFNWNQMFFGLALNYPVSLSPHHLHFCPVYFTHLYISSGLWKHLSFRALIQKTNHTEQKLGWTVEEKARIQHHNKECLT